MQTGYTPPPELKRVSTLALAVGALYLALFVFGLLIDRAQFFHSYLVGFISWIGITLGSMALLMLQHLTGGAWGLIIRRVLEAATRTLPLMLILFLPILLRLSQIYSWTNKDEMDQVPALREKTAHYLNPALDLRSEEHTSELQSLTNLVCRLLLEKKKNSNIMFLLINRKPKCCLLSQATGLDRHRSCASPVRPRRPQYAPVQRSPQHYAKIRSHH